MTMKFTAPREDILTALKHAKRACGKNSALPILAMVLVEVGGLDSVRFTGTNLEHHIRAVFQLQDENLADAEAGSLCLDAQTLALTVSQAPKGAQVSVREGKDRWVTVGFKIGKRSIRKRLPGMHPDDFPSVPEPAQSLAVDMTARAFLKGVTQTSHAAVDASMAVQRPKFAGVYLRWLGDRASFEAFATDGMRCALVYTMDPLWEITPPAKNATVDKLTEGILLSGDGLGYLSSCLQPEGHITLRYDHETLVVTQHDVEVGVRLIDTPCLPVEQIIKRHNDKGSLLFNRKQLAEAVTRAAKHTGDLDGGLVLIDPAKSEILLYVLNPVTNESYQEPVDAEVDTTFTGQIMFNFEFLRQAVVNLEGEELELFIQGERSALHLSCPEDDNALMILMPRAT